MEIRTETPATIFIADDNPILLQGLDRALRASGYAVVTACDGTSLLELLARTPRLPDLVLLDVMMPGMSGLEVLERMRSSPRWAHLPVVLITAATDEALPANARRHGAEDVLIKPFRLNELLERVGSHVRRGMVREVANPGAVAS